MTDWKESSAFLICLLQSLQNNFLTCRRPVNFLSPRHFYSVSLTILQTNYISATATSTSILWTRRDFYAHARLRCCKKRLIMNDGLCDYDSNVGSKRDILCRVFIHIYIYECMCNIKISQYYNRKLLDKFLSQKNFADI